MLALFARGGPSSVRVAEGLVNYPLERREAESVAVYVGENIAPYSASINAMWQAQTQINALLSLQSNASAQQALQQLSDLLHGMGLNVQLPTLGDASSLIAAQQAALASISAGQQSTATIQAQFAPQLQPYKIKLGDRTYDVTVSPVAARPDLNHLGLRALRDYLVYLGLAKDRAERLTALIASWRGDADASDPGAAGWYVSRPSPYAERRGPIHDWGELYFLEEASPDDVGLLRRHFALHGTGAAVDPDYFDAGAMAALAGITPDEAAKALALRAPQPAGTTPPTLAETIGPDAALSFEQATAMADNSAVAGTSGATVAPLIVSVTFGADTRAFVLDPAKGQVLEDLEVDAGRLPPTRPAPAAGPGAEKRTP